MKDFASAQSLSRPEVPQEREVKPDPLQEKVISCGDCDQPEITLVLSSTIVDLDKGLVMVNLQFTNRTIQNVGFLFSAVSLNDPAGDTYRSQPMSVFVAFMASVAASRRCNSAS